MKKRMIWGLAMVLIAGMCSAATRTWTGDGADGKWSTVANWGGTAPVASDSLVFDGTKNLQTINDLSEGTLFTNVTFNAGAGAFTLNGNRFILAGTLANNGQTTQTVACTVTVLDSRTVHTFGPVVFAGALDYQPTASSMIYKTGTNEWIFTGSSSMPPSDWRKIELKAGTIRFASNSVFRMPIYGSTVRDTLRTGYAANQKTKLVVEPGADVTLGTIMANGNGTQINNSFDMTVGGRLYLSGAEQSFGDQLGSTISLVVTDGAKLSMTNAGSFNVGIRSPMTMTIEDGDVAVPSLCFGRGTGSGAGRLGGRSTLWLNKGSLTINGMLEWNSTDDQARVNRVTLGDGRRGMVRLFMGSQQRGNASATNYMVFNGGVLVPNADFNLPPLVNAYVGVGGLIVSNAATRSWGLTGAVPLRPDPALGSTVDGGITKQGSGELAFSNPTNFISGPIRVEDGKLRFSSDIQPGTIAELYVAEGKNFSLRGSFRQVLTPARVQIGGSTTKTALELDVDTAGAPASCDRINLPRGAVIGKLSIYLYPRSGTGLTDPINAAGDYPLFGYETEPDVRDWTHENVGDNVTSSFYIDRVNKLVGIRLTLKATAETIYTWANPIGGSWDVATNWSTAVVPADSPYAYSRLWNVLTTPATVTVNRDVRQKGVSFRGLSYTVSGSGRLLLGYDSINGGEGYLVADTGSHVVDVPVVAMTALGLGGSGTTIVNRAISGNASVYTRNNGLVYLNAANSFTGGLKVTSGSILVMSNALAAGSGPLTFNGGRVTVSGSYTLANAWEVNATSVLDIAANTVRLSGPLTASGGAQLMRRGTGTLELAGSADFTATYPSLWMREGTTRFVSGANYSMVAGPAAREILLLDSGSLIVPVALEIEAGATVNTSGLWARNGNATVLVKGTFNAVSGEVTLANTEGAANTDFIVDGGQFTQGDQWFMLGVNSLARLIVTNGGSAVVGRLSLAGYGDSMGGAVRSGSCVVQVAPNSVLDVRNSVIWLTGLQANTNVLKTAILRVDGGTAILPASSRNPASLTLGIATLVLNGGRFVCSGLPTLTSVNIATPALNNYLQGVDAVLLGVNGITFDTQAYDVTVTQPLALEQASSAGVIKTGVGALTLAGGLAPVPVTLNQGALTIASSNRVAALTLNGGLLSAGSALTVDGALTVGGATTIRWTGTQAGSFTLFTYGALAGSASALSVVGAQAGLTYALRDTGSAIVVDVTAQTTSTWAADADGTWEAMASWNNQIVPNSESSMAVFSDLFSASRTVTLGSAVVLATLQMNAQLAPLVQGGALSVALIDVTAGQPVLASPLLVAGTTVIQTQPGARAVVAGEITGSGVLAVNGAVVLTGTNLATTVTVASGGELAVGAPARLEAPIVLDGGALRSAGTAETPSAVSVTAKGATVGPADSATLTLSGTVGGAGVMTKVGNGALKVSALPDSALIATIGSLEVTSTAPQTWTNALTINNTVVDTAVVLRHAGDLTLSGPVNVVNGRLLKAGAGTLSLTYPGKMTFASPNAANADQLVNIGAHGESPTQGLRGFSIVDGTVVLGVPGQLFTLSGAVQIGMNSTTVAGQETAAHMIFNEGTFVCWTDINVGRGNGSTVTAPVPLQSSFTMNGGTLTAAAFSIGHRSGLDTSSVYQASPRVTINDGVATVTRINMGEYQGCQAEFTVNGGRVVVTDLIQIGNQWPGGTGVFRVNDGRVEVANSINLGVATGSTGTLYLAGGVFKVNQVVKGSGYGCIVFDGGTLIPWQGPMTQPNVILIREGGMKVDTQSLGYTIGTPIQRAGDVVTDGGITKLGPGYLRMSVSPDYNGPTLVSEGELGVVSGAYLPAATVLTIAPGAQFTGTEGASVTNMRTTVLAGLNWGVANHAKAATLTLQVATPTAYDRIQVNGPVTIGTAQVQLVKLGSTAPVPFNGVYDLLAYQGDDPSVAGLSVANPLSNHAYAFSVDSVRKVVVLTVTTAGSATAADVVWTAGSGVWNEATNWLDQTVPVQTTGVASFPANATNATVTVNTAATVGALNVEGSYTFNGASVLTLAGNAGAPAIAISADTEFKNPLTLAAGIEAIPQLNGRRLIVGSVAGTGAALTLTNVGMLQVNGGTVSVPVNVKTGVLEIVNSGTVSGDVLFGAGSRIDSWSDGTLSGDVSLGMGERVMRPIDGALTVSGKVTGFGALTKDGAGTLALAGANSYQGITTNRQGFLAVKDGGTLGQGDVTMVSGTSFGAVGTTHSTVTNRMIFLGSPILRTEAPLLTRGELVAPTNYGSLSKSGISEWQIGASYALSNLNSRFMLNNGMTRIMPGVQFSFTSFDITTNTSESTATRAQVALEGGVQVNSGLAVEPGASVVLGALAAQFTTGYTNTFTLEMNGGSLLLEGFYPLSLGDQGGCQITVLNKGGVMQTARDDGWCDVGTRSPVIWIVDGGTSTLGRVAFGRKEGSGTGRLGGSTKLTIKNGLWEARTFFSWKSVDDPAVTNIVNLGNGSALQGVFSIPPSVRYHSTGRMIMNQNGGVLRMRPYAGYGTSSDFIAGMDEWNVGPGVVGFDTLSNVTATIKQAMTISGSGDSGLVKSGAGAVTLTQDVALTGAVTVAEGCLKANLTRTTALNVYSNGTFDLGMMPAGLIVESLTGTGALTNGSVSVSKSFDIGDTAATIGVIRPDALTLLSGAVVKFDANATTNDLFAVKNTFAAESNVTLDFGREEGDPIAVPSREYVIGTYGVNGGVAAGWKAINTGLPATTRLNAVVTARNGIVTLQVRYGGMVMILR